MNLLEGARFTLTRDGADLGTYSTAPGGTVTLPMLTTGTYILTETVPPAGYRGLTEPIRLKVEAGTITDVTPGASGTSFWKLTGSGGAYTLTATNAIDYELPAVGGPGIYLSMLLGTGPCVPWDSSLPRRSPETARAAAKDGIDQSVCNQTILENTIKIKKGSNL